MTQQAARVGDPHACPLVTPSPHVGGSILPAGCPTVVIGGQPAARIGNLGRCSGPADMIRSGAPAVLIGSLAPGDTVAELFRDAYMCSLIGKTWPGADSDELRDAMNTWWQHRHDPHHPEVAGALQKLAAARGQPLSEIQAEWGKYQAALAEQERIAAARCSSRKSV